MLVNRDKSKTRSQHFVVDIISITGSHSFSSVVCFLSKIIIKEFLVI